jgi:ribosomal protein S18 acetylase RimI-like enzyme
VDRRIELERTTAARRKGQVPSLQSNELGGTISEDRAPANEAATQRRLRASEVAPARRDARDPELDAIRTLDPHELARLEPLWVALHDYHVLISPRLAGLHPRSPEESWRRRWARYARWLEDPDTFVLVAERGGDLVGYAFVTFGMGWSSWNSGERIAELQTLSIAPSSRGQGLGSQLLAAVRDMLAAKGIQHMAIGALVSNIDAQRFYERHGFNKAELVLVGPTTTDVPSGLARSSAEQPYGL